MRSENIKDNRLFVRISTEEKRKLMEVARTHGGVSEWILEQLVRTLSENVRTKESQNAPKEGAVVPLVRTGVRTDGSSEYCSRCHNLKRYCRCG